MISGRDALVKLACTYKDICDALGQFRFDAAVVQDAVVDDPELAHLAPLAGQVRENILTVLDQLHDAIPGELGEMMEAAGEFAGE